MATTELGVAYISIVPETKTFTEELEKASKTGGEKFGKDFKESVNKSVKADGGLGKDVTDELEKNVKQKLPAVGGAIKDALQKPLDDLKSAAGDYSTELGKQLLSGNVKGATDQLSGSIQGVTDLISGIGEKFGAQTGAVQTASDGIISNIDKVGSSIQGAIDKTDGWAGKFSEIHGQTNDLISGFQTLSGIDLGSGKLGSSLEFLSKNAGLIESTLRLAQFLYENTPPPANEQSAANRAKGRFPELQQGGIKFGPNPLGEYPGGGGSGVGPHGAPGAGRPAPPAPTSPLFPSATKSGQNPLDVFAPVTPTTSTAVAPAAKSTALPGPGEVKKVVMGTFAAAGYSPDELAKLDYIIMHESHYDIDALNPATGDFGTFQFNPAAGNVQRYLPDKSLNPQVQANAGLRYIQEHWGGDINAAYQHKLETGWYEQGGAVPIIAHEGEHVLTAADVQALGGQAGVYDFRKMLHMEEGGGVGSRLDPYAFMELTGQFNPGIKIDTSTTHVQTVEESWQAFLALNELREYNQRRHGGGAGRMGRQGRQYGEGGAITPEELAFMMNANQAKTPAEEESSARTKGYTPPVSNVGGVPGTSTISKFLQLGNEAVGGVIDLGAQAAKMGISAAAGAGSLGAGAAAGPAAGIGIDIASSIAKRGVSYGFQMAGIGADALVENLFSPFGGAPRWLGYDYTKFAPSLDPLKTRATGAIGDAIKNRLPAPHQGTGAPPGPVDPQQLPGQQGVGAPTPGLGQKPENQNDWFSMFGFDNGGWLQPNSVGVNMTGRPEAILSPEQWDAMSSASAGGGYGTNIEHLHVSDVEAMGRELDKRGRLNMMRYSGRP